MREKVECTKRVKGLGKRWGPGKSGVEKMQWNVLPVVCSVCR